MSVRAAHLGYIPGSCLRPIVPFRQHPDKVVGCRVLEQAVKKPGWFGGWTTFTLDGDSYQSFGDMIAWRVTLWEENVMLGEQKSFLW